MKRSLLLSMAIISVHNAEALFFSYQEILSAQYQMTQQEQQHFLNYLITQANQNPNQQLFKELLIAFKAGNYPLVMKKLHEQTIDLAQVLHVSPLRSAMIEGELAPLLWFIREIAALDWFIEQNSTEKLKLWASQKDLALYLLGLVGQLERNFTRITDPQVLNDSSETLRRFLIQLKPNQTVALQHAIDQAFDKLTMIESIYTTIK